MATSDTFSDFKSGTDYTAGQAKAGIDDASTSLKDVVNKYGQKAGEAVQYASQTYHDAKDVAQQSVRQIRGKPVQAALIAGGVGFLIGTLLPRRRSVQAALNAGGVGFLIGTLLTRRQ